MSEIFNLNIFDFATCDSKKININHEKKLITTKTLFDLKYKFKISKSKSAIDSYNFDKWFKANVALILQKKFPKHFWSSFFVNYKSQLFKAKPFYFDYTKTKMTNELIANEYKNIETFLLKTNKHFSISVETFISKFVQIQKTIPEAKCVFSQNMDVDKFLAELRKDLINENQQFLNDLLIL